VARNSTDKGDLSAAALAVSGFDVGEAKCPDPIYFTVFLESCMNSIEHHHPLLYSLKLNSVHPETRYFVLDRGALANYRRHIVNIPKVKFDNATKSQGKIHPGYPLPIVRKRFARFELSNWE